MWSKAYEVTDAEARELYNAMRRRDGLFYLAAAAGFAADHMAQGDPLDFGRLFKAYRDQTSSRSWSAAAMKIRLSTDRSTSRKNGWASSASRSSGYPAVTLPRMSSPKPWQP